MSRLPCLPLIVVLLASLTCSGPATAQIAPPQPQAQAQPPAAGIPELVAYDGGYFEIDVPQGWYVYTYGACEGWLLRVYDTANPAAQFFLATQSGPFYLNENQRALDAQVAGLYGYPYWYELPAVNPLDCATFFSLWSQMARIPLVQQNIPYCPKLDDLRVINSQPWQGIVEGRTELVTATFTEDGWPGEGYLQATLSTLLPYTGAPWAGIGMAGMVFGVCAPPGQIAAYAPVMQKCFESLKFDEDYLDDCRDSQKKRSEQQDKWWKERQKEEEEEKKKEDEEKDDEDLSFGLPSAKFTSLPFDLDPMQAVRLYFDAVNAALAAEEVAEPAPPGG